MIAADVTRYSTQDVTFIIHIILKLSHKVSESRIGVWDLDFTTHFLASYLLFLA